MSRSMSTSMSTSTSTSMSTVATMRAPRDGRLPGIMFMAIVSFAWATNALIGGALELVGIAAMALAGGLVVAFAILTRRMRTAEIEVPVAPTADTGRGPALMRSRGFVIACLAEVVGFMLVIATLGRIDPALVMPGIALVVALHFILIHRAFGGGIHLVMTAVGSVVALAGIAAIVAGVDADLVRALVGLGMGAITLTYGWLFAGTLAREYPSHR